MSLTAKMKVDLVLSLDEDQKNLLWSFTDTALNQIVRSDMTVHSAGVVRIAALATVAIPMGDVGHGYMVLIATDKEVQIKVNGGTDKVTVKPYGSYKGLWVLHGEITAVSVENKESTAVAQVEYCIAGIE
jgi:hypothetical protein